MVIPGRAAELSGRSFSAAGTDGACRSLTELSDAKRPSGRRQWLDSGTGAGEAFLAELRRDGVPRHLVDAGFASVADFWPPWCVLIDDGVIAAMAFAARISAEGAAVGVYTFSQFRGRGLAAAVTARWSSHHTLADRKLFYGPSVTNTSSQQVAARLGLERVGMMLRVV